MSGTEAKRRQVEGLIRGMPKDYREVVKAALAQGWSLTQHGKGHPKLTSPDGAYATPVPATSSSGNLRKAVVSRLRKHGLTYPA